MVQTDKVIHKKEGKKRKSEQELSPSDCKKEDSSKHHKKEKKDRGEKEKKKSKSAAAVEVKKEDEEVGVLKQELMDLVSEFQQEHKDYKLGGSLPEIDEDAIIEKQEKKKEKKEKKDKKKISPEEESKKTDKETIVAVKTEPIKMASSLSSDVTEFRASNGISVEIGKNEELKPILSFAEGTKEWSPELKKTIEKFEKPTPIQSECWPYAMKGKDVIGIAETGSGKTLAFGIPLFSQLVKCGRPLHGALIMAPTRELAIQIHDTLEEAGKPLGLKSICLFGGVSKYDHIKALKSSRHNIIVATPGRLIDLIDGEVLNLKSVTYLVLDEADRMLDMGFEKDVRRIMKEASNAARQTVMFSATWPTSIRSLANEFLKNPVRITIGSDELTANQNVSQTVHVVKDNFAKEQVLMDLLKKHHKNRDNRVLVFALYKKEAARVETFLQRRGYNNVQSIHGDKSQVARMEALEKFKSGECPLLVATDVAARGLDIPNVEVVINYTFPLTIEEYIHRIGRTGRAGKKGISITLFSPFDKTHSGSLIQVLKTANQPVPEDLLKFGTTIKKKEHKDYGAFYKEVDPNVKSSHVKFDDSDSE